MGEKGSFRRHLSSRSRRLSFVCLSLALLASPALTHAELRTVTGSGDHELREQDTKQEGIRLATEAAKRDALEQVATYLESITVSTDFNLDRDEIRTYTAGMVNVLDEHLSITAEDDVVTFHIDLTAQIDTDEVAEAVKKLKEHEEVRQELASLKAEVDQLQQELDQANHALASGLPPEEAAALADRRTELLNQMQSNGLVQQAWTDWIVGGPYAWPYGYGYPYGVSVPGLLAWAGRLYPANPHVPVVSQVITARTGAPMPPVPPHPPTAPGSIPAHQQLVTPLPVPANAVISTPAGSRSFQRLQSFLPQAGTVHPGGQPSSMFIQTHPGSTNSSSRPQSVVPQIGSQRLRQFLPSPGYALPPTTRAVPPPAFPPRRGQFSPGISGYPRMHPSTPRYAPRSVAPSSSSGGGRSGSSVGRGGGGHR